MRLKNRLFALSLAALLGVSNLSVAATYASVSAARSSSYRGGFSSQKSQSARPANSPARSTKNTSFGSFGLQPGQNGGRSDSAMHRDMEKNQAQQQALKNLDARNRQKSAAQPGQQTSVSGKPLSPAPGAAPLPQNAPAVIVQRESGSMGGALLGFMLGQAISRPHVANSNENRNRDLQPLESVGAVSNGLENPDGKGASGMQAPVQAAESESGVWTFLRLLLWLGLLSGLGWISYRLYRFFMPAQRPQTHYSLTH